MIAPPTFEVGDRVTASFEGRIKRYAGTVRAVKKLGPTARPQYDVDFDDGEFWPDIPEEELQPGPSLQTIAEELRAQRPSEEQLSAAKEKLREFTLPPSNIDEQFMPGGLKHCAGDLTFPNVTLVDEFFSSFLIPLFMMAPRAVAIFPGAHLCHCTTAHHDAAHRKHGCQAHVSFAVQTPAAVLGVRKQSAERNELHTRLITLGAQDLIHSAHWNDAVWIPVWHFKDAKSPTARLDYDAETMKPLPWKKIVLYDVEIGKSAPLVMYDIDGGLLEATASLARRHFDFLDKWSFVLNRHHNESECSGCLHLDGRGDQRMEMLGIHNRLRNAFQPPDKARADFVVANKGGDLDAYVIHFDDLERFGGAALKPIWEGLSERMKALLPSSMESLSQALQDAGVRERLYSQAANECVSTDLLVNNVGVSSAYQSPPHFDVGDIGWTFAFACKCDHNCKVRVRPPKDVEVEEEEEEVEDGGVFDGVAVEEGSEYDSEDEPLRKRLEEDEPLRKRIKSKAPVSPLPVLSHGVRSRTL